MYRCSYCQGMMAPDVDNEWACCSCGRRVYPRVQEPTPVTGPRAVSQAVAPGPDDILSELLAAMPSPFLFNDLLQRAYQYNRGWNASKLKAALQARGYTFHRPSRWHALVVYRRRHEALGSPRVASR